MPIKFSETNKQFHLYNDEVSYILKVIENGQLGQLYYGKRLTHREDFSHLFELAQRDMAACPFEGNSKFSLENIKQEYPTLGNGDVRYPAYEIEQESGSKVVDFKYREHRIYPGKPKLKGLPATYVEDENEATTLEIVLEDNIISSKIVLNYTIYENMPVITKSVRFENYGYEKITLLSAMSGCMDLADNNYSMIDLAGAWTRERSIRERNLDYGTQGVHSMRGCSSHQFNPFIALKRKNADEFSGEVLGFSLVYSGDFLAQVEVDNYDVTRVLMGIHPNGFKWTLKEGEKFQTPEVVMVYSDNGLNKMSQTYHKLYRNRLARGVWRDKVRPILINNWEATYFNFDEDRILDIAQTSSELGIELFVLDDGWFGKRDDATSSLGDWYPHKSKLPDGVNGIAKKIEQMGMKFGIWFEPEMVNKDSDLYREHPDWVLSDPQRIMCHSRNQYVLDFSKEEVREYIYQLMYKILSSAPISYIKWDMNRNFSEVFSRGNDSEYQGKVRHKYILGVYELYERLIQQFPEILFESCASGGARFDPGILYYAPQGWTSDNTDAIHRLEIQYGTSMVYPISSMGSHVSAAPNHQTFRNTPIETRANVAYFGTFGYELDINKLEKDELEKIKQQVIFMKEYRGLIQSGDFYRLESPFEGNVTAWMVVSKDKKEALVGYYRLLQPANLGFKRLKLRGLLPEKEYEVTEQSYTSFGDELMQSGLIVSDFASGKFDVAKEVQGDYMSRLFYLKTV